MLGISRIPPAQATSEGGDSCMNALKVIHGFALIIGPCNIVFRGLVPLFISYLSTYKKQTSGKQEHRCFHEECELHSRTKHNRVPLIYIPLLYPIHKISK